MSKGLKYTFLIHTIVGIVFGLAMLLVPATFASMIKWTPVDTAMGRMFGAIMVAVGVSSWLAYSASEWAQVRIVAGMEKALTVLALLASLYSVLVEAAPMFAWVNAGLFLVFAILFFVFGKEATG